jgi:hypothetical protein
MTRDERRGCRLQYRLFERRILNSTHSSTNSVFEVLSVTLVEFC